MSSEESASGSSAARSFWSGSVTRFINASEAGSFYDLRAGLVAAVAAPEHRCGTALDVGCGSGLLTERLAGAGWAVTGIDLSPEQVERARERSRGAGPRPSYLVGGLEAVAEGERFNLVCAIGVLPYIADQPAFVAALATRVAPAGHLIVTTTRAASLFTAVALARHCLQIRMSGAWLQVAANLARTGIWSGGFVAWGRSRRLRGSAALDAEMRRLGFSLERRLGLYGVGTGDAAALARGALASWIALRLGWCVVHCYRRWL